MDYSWGKNKIVVGLPALQGACRSQNGPQQRFPPVTLLSLPGLKEVI